MIADKKDNTYKMGNNESTTGAKDAMPMLNRTTNICPGHSSREHKSTKLNRTVTFVSDHNVNHQQTPRHQQHQRIPQIPHSDVPLPPIPAKPASLLPPPLPPYPSSHIARNVTNTLTKPSPLSTRRTGPMIQMKKNVIFNNRGYIDPRQPPPHPTPIYPTTPTTSFFNFCPKNFESSRRSSTLRRIQHGSTTSSTSSTFCSDTPSSPDNNSNTYAETIYLEMYDELSIETGREVMGRYNQTIEYKLRDLTLQQNSNSNVDQMIEEMVNDGLYYCRNNEIEREIDANKNQYKNGTFYVRKSTDYTKSNPKFTLCIYENNEAISYEQARRTKKASSLMCIQFVRYFDVNHNVLMYKINERQINRATSFNGGFLSIQDAINFYLDVSRTLMFSDTNLYSIVDSDSMKKLRDLKLIYAVTMCPPCTLIPKVVDMCTKDTDYVLV